MNPCQGLRGVQIEPKLLKGLWGERLVDIVLLGIHLVRGGNLWISGVNTGLDGKHGLQLGLSVVTRTSLTLVESKAEWQCPIDLFELCRVVYLVTFFLGQFHDLD
jgi:hypothetical protein